ncbi:MAG: hypothetical protein ACKVS6_10785 [Planctomycetota bacterium]
MPQHQGRSSEPEHGPRDREEAFVNARHRKTKEISPAARRVKREDLTTSSAHLVPLGLIPEEMYQTNRRKELLDFLARRDAKLISQKIARELAVRSILLDAASLTARTIGYLAVIVDSTKNLQKTAGHAIQRIIQEALEESMSGNDSELPPPGNFTILKSQEAARDLCRQFNKLPERERIAAYRMIILREDVETVARELSIEKADLEKSLKAALSKLQKNG